MAIVYRQNQEGRLSVEQMDGNFEYIETRLAPLTYIGLASQVDDQAPTFIELQNTIGDITWEYSDAGSYIGTVGTTFSYIFVPNNDAIFATPLGVSSSAILYIYQITKLSESTISLVTVPFEGPGAGTSDNILQNTPIEIKFYKETLVC